MELYQHNKEAYDKIQTMFQREDRVAIIHATGTGKSFISLQWLYDNRDKKCLFLAPTYEILDQLERHMQSQGLSLKTFPNLKCMVYDNLASLSVQTLNNLHVDNIVLDEFHRCGAPTWGKAVNTVFQNNPTAKVLGITATPVRYLDNQRNMAQEIFNGNIASEISLSDAIADGILPMPKYISAVYSFDEDLQRIQNKIEKVQNPRDKDILQKDLEAAKRTLEKAEGLPEIFAKHLPVRNGKYIVFCKDFAHMQRMMQEACGWLKDINPNLDIYSVCSEQSREINQRNVADFERFQNDHIKLLFSIEMLNEGVHVNDVDGVIMLRPTSSPIIYLQQLGRALSVGHKEHPIIFDIVNNINSNKIIYNVYKEVKEKLSGQQRNRNKKVNLADFKIVDELKEPSEFIEALDDLLDNETIANSNLDALVQQLIEFKQQYGRMPSGSNPDERRLYETYKCHRDGFTNEQMQLLKAHGIIVKPKRTNGDIIQDNVDEVIEFKKRYGRLPKTNSMDLSERHMYQRFSRNRSLNKFTKEQIQQFNEVGIVFASEEERRNMRVSRTDKVDSTIDALIKFKKINGRMPAVDAESLEERSLAYIYHNTKDLYTSEQLEYLAENEILVVTKNNKVSIAIDRLIQFKKSTGRRPSSNSESFYERSLNTLYHSTKKLYTPEQVNRLAENGILIKEEKTINEIIEFGVNELLNFFVKNHRMPSSSSEDKKECSIYSFYARYRDKFTDGQLEMLRSHGVVISKKRVNTELVENCVINVINFFVENHRMPMRDSKNKSESSLGEAFKRNRENFTIEQKQRLIAAGVPVEKLEKKTKCTIDPADGKRVLKQRQKDDLQNGGLTQ